jgi:hypothetical protein
MLKQLRALPVLLLLAGLVTGCQSIPAIASLMPAAGPFLTITTRGGECPAGACESITIIERDGRLHMTEPDVAELGAIPAAALTMLDAAVRSTDFAAIRAQPFRGECPVNFDGQETIYEFATPSGIERLESCQSDIDPAHPLFAALTSAMQAVLRAEPT